MDRIGIELCRKCKLYKLCKVKYMGRFAPCREALVVQNSTSNQHIKPEIYNTCNDEQEKGYMQDMGTSYCPHCGRKLQAVD